MSQTTSRNIRFCDIGQDQFSSCHWEKSWYQYNAFLLISMGSLDSDNSRSWKSVHIAWVNSPAPSQWIYFWNTCFRKTMVAMATWVDAWLRWTLLFQLIDPRQKYATIILLGLAGYEAIDNIIILYPASSSRKIVLLKTPWSTTLPCWFYSGPKRLLSAICSQSC